MLHTTIQLNLTEIFTKNSSIVVMLPANDFFVVSIAIPFFGALHKKVFSLLVDHAHYKRKSKQAQLCFSLGTQARLSYHLNTFSWLLTQYFCDLTHFMKIICLIVTRGPCYPQTVSQLNLTELVTKNSNTAVIFLQIASL